MASKNNKRSSQQSKPDKPVRKPRKTTATNKAAEKPAHQNSGPIVVGIGASAGGLKALQDFFSALPSDTGMAFVVITHLHPEHESHLAELLQKHTQMSTKQVVKKTSVQPNHVYVIPPNRRIMMTDSHLDIAEFRQPHGKRIP